MSGTASIGNRVKFQMPKLAIARMPTITNQRWRTEKDRMPSIMVRRSFPHFRLQDETVPGRIHVAFQHAESDLDKLRIALADLDVARLELVTAADEDDGPVLDRLQRQ